MPLPDNVALRLIVSYTTQADNAYNKDSDNEDAEFREDVLSFSGLSAFVSALKYKYRVHKVTMSESLLQDLGTLLTGYKNTIADLRQNGRISAMEGKQPLSLDLYH